MKRFVELMKKTLPLLLILIVAFSGCRSQKDISHISDSYLNLTDETSRESENINSFADKPSDSNVPDFADSLPQKASVSEKAASNNNSSRASKPSSPKVNSTDRVSNDNKDGTLSQSGTVDEKDQVHLYSYIDGRGLVIQVTFDYKEGDTWAELLKNNTEISTDTTYDVNFNTIEYLKYNGKAIVFNNTPVKKDDIVSKKNIYKLETLAGPAKISATTMYDLINIELVFEGGSYRHWYIRKYDIKETSKTSGNITISYIKVIEYSEPNEAFNGTTVDINQTPLTLTYTSNYGLYAGKTIELSDGSKILLGNDLYWFYLGNSNNKRILCEDYRLYKSVPNNPNDSYWDYYWSKLK